MKPIRIKGVDLKFSLSSDMCLIEETTSGEIQTALIQSLAETSFFKSIGIRDLVSLSTAGITYNVSLPAKKFPKAPKTQNEFIDYLNRAIALTKAILAVHHAKYCFGILSDNRIMIGRNGELIVLGLNLLQKEYSKNDLTAYQDQYFHFLAPEYSKRSNVKPDHRADFYGLGVLIHYWLTGEHFIKASDKQEVLYKHLTEPYQGGEGNAAWKHTGIYSIIGGLLEKKLTDRYQSAHGILKDLTNLQFRLSKGEFKNISKLSTTYNPGVINVSQVLLEREDALQKLLEKYYEVREGASAVVFLEGSSGVGKTRLGKAFESAIAEKDVLYSMGGFDQAHSTPYRAIQRAFQNVAQRILLKSGRSHSEIRDILISGLKSDLSVLFELIPDLKELTGSIPPPEELGPLETGDRFMNCFARYCRTLDGIGLKRVVFLDDVHWSDPSSIKLLEYMALAPISRVMFVLAYNPDGMSKNHDLRQFQRRLQNANKLLPIIRLQPLSQDATQQIVVDSLSEVNGYIGNLARVVYKKTNGNPYYIQHFLQSLQEDKVLTYDNVGHCWQYNLERVKRQEVAENVVAMYAKQLLTQSYQAQILLKVAAYNNGRFDVPLLASVCNFPEEIVVLFLELSTEAGQLSRTDGGHVSYTFNHKGIQQAALYLKIPSFDITHEALHYTLAMYHLNKEKLNDSIVLNQCIEHLLQSRSLLERKTVVSALGFILQAGQLANDSNSPATARKYLDFALELQEKFNLDTLVFEALFGLAKAYYLMKSMDEGKAYAKRALEAASSIKQRYEVYLLNMKFYEAYSRYDENTEEGLCALKALGAPLGKADDDKELTQIIDLEYEKFRNAISDGLEGFMAKDNVPSEVKRYEMVILVNMCTSAHRSNQDLYALILLRLGNLMFQHGSIDSAPFALIHLGSLLCYRYGAYAKGMELGDLGLKMLDATLSHKFYTRTLSVYQISMSHFRETFKVLEKELDEGTEYCIERGDAQGANNLMYAKIRNQLLSGVEVKGFLRLCDESLDTLGINSHKGFTAQVCLLKTIGLMLGGYSSKLYAQNKKKAILYMEECNCQASLASYHVLVGWVYCLRGNYEKADQYYKKHGAILQYATSEPQFFRYRILLSVCELMLMDSPDEKVLDRVASRQQSLKNWAETLPDNFWADYQTVELLMACKSGDFDNLTDKIEVALRFTESSSNIAARALLTDVLQRAMPKERFGFLKEALKNEAVRVFASWGVKFEETKDKIPAQVTSEIYSNQALGFDFQSLIKATQAISAEVNQDRLVQYLLQVVMENAGADKGALVLLNNSEPNVAAFIDLSNSSNIRFSDYELSTSTNLPISLIEHVILSKKELCIDNLAEYYTSSEFSGSTTTGSLLLLPLIKQNNLIGVLYIANSQMTGMFTEGGLEVLRVIASQAAISIANSILYEQAINLNRELATSQKELAKLNQALEGKIKERTRHLRHEIEMRKEAERDLIFAKDDADNANKAKSQFLANMSHEIRTPLNAIVGFAQILANQSKSLDLTYSFRRYLSNIYQSAESLSEIIQDILDLSKIEAGKMAISLEDMDLKQLFLSVYRIQNSLAKAKEVRVIYDLAPGTPRYIRSDRSKIKQILMNIIGNAIKFTPPKNCVRLNLNVEGSFLVFKVSDQGIGIPSSDLEKIFEPFTQADAGTDRKYGGTGLGLAITKSLVENLKGSVSVESEEGKGTCFTIRIPYDLATTSQAEHPEVLFANYRVPLTSKILVVEDHPLNQEMIRGLFAELGSEILVASNGKEGISIAKRFNPDIIFMDIHMPKIDGFETLVMIRKFNPKVPIVGLSADAFKEHQEAALKAGFSAYLTKPIQLGQMVELLKRYLPEATEPSNRVEVLNAKLLEQKINALETLRSLPIFETEKLARVAGTLSDILPPNVFSKLEDAIYTGDDLALQEFLTSTLDAK
ncbi:MAG: ATP-binding protein [Arenibacter algicola]